jgi:hypothetical protein
MEQHRDELDDPYLQLIRDIYTRDMDNTSSSRRWIGLGLVLIVLGGVVGLLLATGNRGHETPDARPPLVSTSYDPASQRQPTGFQEWATRLGPSAGSQQGTHLPDTQAEAFRPAISPPASGATTGRGPSSVSASPRSKALSAHPRLMNQSKRRPACPTNSCLPRVARQRSIPRGQGSLLEEFDPNAVLVRSTP